MFSGTIAVPPTLALITCCACFTVSLNTFSFSSLTPLSAPHHAFTAHPSPPTRPSPPQAPPVPPVPPPQPPFLAPPTCAAVAPLPGGLGQLRSFQSCPFVVEMAVQALDPSREPEDGLCLSVAVVNNNVVSYVLHKEFNYLMVHDNVCRVEGT